VTEKGQKTKKFALLKLRKSRFPNHELPAADDNLNWFKYRCGQYAEPPEPLPWSCVEICWLKAGGMEIHFHIEGN
jgi:hypothetical protein